MSNTTPKISNTNIKIRDFSSPLLDQKEYSSYGERLFSVTAYNDLNEYNLADAAKLENERIRMWRHMANNPYISFAIDDIINEMISQPDDETFPIKIDLSKTELSEDTRNKIHNEFNDVLKKLKFSNNAYGLLRDWYVDGKQIFFIEYSKNGKNITNIKQLDPLRTKKVTEENGETYYLYSDIELSQSEIMFPENCIIELQSGIMDEKHMMWISYLNKAFIPLNQVSSIEDSLVIYRISRAPERRVFYVDVGELSKTKAEQYMREIINNYRNNMEYDKNTGTIREKNNHMSLLDDVWLPRRDGSRGTEVSTLQGGANLGEIDDLNYFIKKLFRSLNIPFSRWGGDDVAANVMGRTTEITRDELKYNKFVQRLRKQYNVLFYILLKSSLNMKNIITADELDVIRDEIIFRWNSDNMFNTLKEYDIYSEQMEILEKLEQYSNKYFSVEWIQRNILKQNDEEIENIKKQIAAEKKLYPRPEEENEY